MDIKISKHKKDIIQKFASGVFKDASLEFYGLKTTKIKELINVELPVLEVSEKSTDFVSLLEDNTYQHYEFQTKFNNADLTRFAMYDIRLYERDKRKIQTVIIYSSDVKKRNISLNIGSLEYKPDVVFMCEYDGNAIYADLETKLKNQQELTNTDMLNLIFLPLMRNNIPKAELAEKSIKLAQTIPDKQKRDGCMASTFAFSFEYLNDTEIKRIMEVFKLSVFERAYNLLVEDYKIQTAKRMLKNGVAVEIIADSTELDIDTVTALKEQLESEENDE
jgi:hypothetical protein